MAKVVVSVRVSPERATLLKRVAALIEDDGYAGQIETLTTDAEAASVPGVTTKLTEIENRLRALEGVVSAKEGGR